MNRWVRVVGGGQDVPRGDERHSSPGWEWKTPPVRLGISESRFAHRPSRRGPLGAGVGARQPEQT